MNAVRVRLPLPRSGPPNSSRSSSAGGGRGETRARLPVGAPLLQLGDRHGRPPMPVVASATVPALSTAVMLCK